MAILGAQAHCKTHKFFAKAYILVKKMTVFWTPQQKSVSSIPLRVTKKQNKRPVQPFQTKFGGSICDNGTRKKSLRSRGGWCSELSRWLAVDSCEETL